MTFIQIGIWVNIDVSLSDEQNQKHIPRNYDIALTVTEKVLPIL
jgi:hypothetical protein